ncbi:MAG: hypothetical protein PHO62_03080 [Sulfurimonas sp.]|uniref:hypothetical protein n=1 Tax=Sulfurimonas sp. TaxID=2022749 RepID=UPI002621E8E2|nr:hypothetical protein [Sulfurimonas sp.]MDD5372393.1 hypothetical protein [Sulfurimonas sp.]
MQEFFLENKVIIVFLHVISGVIWVGGMIAMRYASHQSFLKIESPHKRLEHIAYALKRLFYIVFPFVITLMVTAIFMVKGYRLSESDFSVYAYFKEVIWSVMFLNLMIMIYLRSKGEMLLNKGDMVGAKNQLELIGKIMVPLNIGLGLTAIFFGTYLSSNL